jgi:DNA-binding NtrC family response regulator
MQKATILIADDDEDIRLALNLLLSNEGYNIIEASTPKEVSIEVMRQQPNLVLLDMNFSRDTTSGHEGLAILQQLSQLSTPVILMTAWATIDLAVQGLQQGASDFIEKPWNKLKLLNSIKQQLSLCQLKEQNKGYRDLLAPEEKDWICQSPAMQATEQLIKQIAPTDASVLILGENGTGKSLLAERIHQHSQRQLAPMISVNMAAIPDNLFESELFGHQKGAFTDAKQSRVGRFQLAEQGTLFLDEIGTLPQTLQPKLLRVLETGQFEVLGSSQTQIANVRLISATNADLNALVANNNFRQDLLYRLNTLVITLPPLRERLDDIQALTENFILKFSRKYQKLALTLSPCAVAKLKQHNWPGNVRELSHAIERAVLLAPSNIITAEQLLLDSNSNTSNDITLQPLDKSEKQLIEKAMNVTQGQVIEAAKLLGISRNALYRRLEKFGIHYVAE